MYRAALLQTLFGLVVLPGCGGDSGAADNGADSAGTEGTSATTSSGTTGTTTITAGNTSATDGGSTSATTSGGATAGTATATGGGSLPSPEGGMAIAANETVGLDWISVDGADSYRIYWSTSAGVTPASPDVLSVADPGEVHRALTNGTTYYYVITAVDNSGESEPSVELSATPGGEWALEELGHGVMDDVLTGGATAKIPLAARNHILLFAEGYTASDLTTFHTHADHDADRDGDVDRWVDLVFSIEPYPTFRESFVLWTIPRASNTDINAANPDTAWAVPVDVSTNFPGTQSIPSDGETATRAWAALLDHPVVPADFSGGGFGTARTHTASFLIYDPDQGKASVSGRATSLRNPADTSQRLSSAFGVGHAHEFTHAFSAMRDEYLENDNSPPTPSPTSNVTNTSTCEQLPWAHLLDGSGINDTAELVGAFGVPAIGYHSELLCLMNGTHDNAQYYGGSGLLRVEDRMCNFCREMTTYRIFQRGGLLDGGDSFDQWVANYRDVFFERFGFAVPSPVPQTNDPGGNGTPIYEGCTQPLVVDPGSAVSIPAAKARGCLPADALATP